MESIVVSFLSKLELGELQVFSNMAVFPLLTQVDQDPEYLTLKEALEKSERGESMSTSSRRRRFRG